MNSRGLRLFPVMNLTVFVVCDLISLKIAAMYIELTICHSLITNFSTFFQFPVLLELAYVPFMFSPHSLHVFQCLVYSGKKNYRWHEH